jgi:hypothetical protein
LTVSATISTESKIVPICGSPITTAEIVIAPLASLSRSSMHARLSSTKPARARVTAS